MGIRLNRRQLPHKSPREFARVWRRPEPETPTLKELTFAHNRYSLRLYGTQQDTEEFLITQHWPRTLVYRRTFKEGFYVRQPERRR